ncbi:nucleotidyltransferase family protein [Spirosoma litoris]
MIHPFLADQLPIVTRILKENGVKRAYAFGSVCTDRFTETSDVDLLIGFDESLDPVSYSENYFTIAHALESVLNRPVDLVTERSLKNPYFITVLEQTKTAIYE